MEEFLQEKSLAYESRNLCSTYVMIDEESVKTKKLRITGYFTLSFKVLNLACDISNSKRRKLFHGFLKQENALPAILIGQLGKHIDENTSDVKLTGQELLDAAMSIITDVNGRIPCSVIVLECMKEVLADNAGVHSFYQNYGFSALQERDEYIQYVYFLR